MARVDVVMPQMGESIAEGTVSRWLKQVGDDVKRDEAILEISTDKVDAEIPAPAAGVLAEIKVDEGQTVEIQTVVAVIETEKGAAVPAPSPTPPVESAAPAPPTAEEVKAEPVMAPATATAAASRGGGVESAEERLQQKSTPLVRRIAAEHDVDLETVPGTGHAGRVTKKDILGYIETRQTVPVTGSAVTVSKSGAPPISSVPSATGVSGGGEISHPIVDAWPGDRVEPMSRIRKLTADHMVMSRRIAAHVTSYYEVDFTRIAEIRAAKKAEYERRGARLTFLAFIAKVVAENLRQHPILNASVSGNTIIYRQDINIGIAVALDWGLIVPVMQYADELSLAGLARRMADLGERARTKRLNPDEVQRGTFTITNPGVFGSYIGAPIINQPQVAILGVGTIEKRPKVITMDDGQDVIAIRMLGMLSLSYDHRVVDGADADRFMSDVKQGLEGFAEGAT
ncbi:MAG: 2-oxo acid dehydrogenase subunit E2 [Gemmatimonadota bacterium]|nr:MAG: 2-oxo acid dehydrogenase subunit E2 [Gemmatimonadota bacterium]